MARTEEHDRSRVWWQHRLQQAAWALLPLAISGCGSAGDGGQSDAAPATVVESKGFSTPDECFQALRNAAVAKDYEQLLSCLTAESHTLLASALVMAGSVSKAMSSFAAAGGEMTEPMKQGLDAIDEVLAKHGINDEAFQQANLMAGDPAELTKLAAPIEDKRAFILEMMTAMEPLSAMQGGGGPDLTGIDGELVDVAIEGDRATGKVRADDGRSEDVIFQNSADGWKLHFDLQQLMAGGGAP